MKRILNTTIMDMYNNYKQILEAVNRGILLALDDFDNEEQILHVKSKLILNRDYTKEYLDLLRNEVVDLGLPSKTLWCKYNLDVDPNLLTKTVDWYGKYYAWGELKSNKTNEDGEIYFSWNNYKYYKFGNGNKNLTKYCNDPDYGLNGFNDNLTQLLPEDDAAYQNKKFYNFKFHIPTKEQFEELKNYTISYWVNNYDPNKLVHTPKDDGGIKGLNGRVFVGKNANLMFIPAAGCHSNSNIYHAGSYCYLYSSSLYLYYPSYAYYLYFNSDIISVNYDSRYYGCSVRPVINL